MDAKEIRQALTGLIKARSDHQVARQVLESAHADLAAATETAVAALKEAGGLAAIKREGKQLVVFMDGDQDVRFQEVPDLEV